MRNEVARVRFFQLFILRICRPQAVEFAVNQSEWPNVAPRPILCGLGGTFMRSLPLSGHWALMSEVLTRSRKVTFHLSGGISPCPGKGVFSHPDPTGDKGWSSGSVVRALLLQRT